MIRINVEAVVDLCGLFLPPMTANRAGAVLNTASTAAFQPFPGQAAYAASKAFVLSYSQALNAEQAGTGVSVTALCPGPVRTEFNEVAGIGEEAAARALPRILWLSADDVAHQAIDGMVKGRAVVIPGKANAAGAALAHLTPRRVLLPIVARQHPSLRARS